MNPGTRTAAESRAVRGPGREWKAGNDTDARVGTLPLMRGSLVKLEGLAANGRRVFRYSTTTRPVMKGWGSQW